MHVGFYVPNNFYGLFIVNNDLGHGALKISLVEPQYQIAELPTLLVHFVRGTTFLVGPIRK